MARRPFVYEMGIQEKNETQKNGTIKERDNKRTRKYKEQEKGQEKREY